MIANFILDCLTSYWCLTPLKLKDCARNEVYSCLPREAQSLFKLDQTLIRRWLGSF